MDSLAQTQAQVVFENRVLRRIFGPKRDDVTGEWRKLHNEELHNLYSSPDIIRQIESQGELCGHGMWHAWGRREKYTRFWLESLKERAHLEDQGTDGRMGSEWLLGRLAGLVWIGFNWLRIGADGELL
jgi:hypothetical protein